MYIKSLTLKNYRCYEDLQVDFNKECTILVGVNGAGKSTILDAVYTALGSFIDGFDGIISNGISREDAHRKMFELGSCVDAEEQYPVDIAKFVYKMKSHEMEIEYRKGDCVEKLPMRLLSDGLKTTISMVADIAYRMAVLNPQLLDNILEETPGIDLIDEVDMHLHPAWQKRIVEDLHYIFPKLQFIMTTHSPSVLANVKHEHILLLEDCGVALPGNTTYGRDVSDILREMMKVDVCPEDVVRLKADFYRLLAEEKYDLAKECRVKLEQILGENDADVVRTKISYELEVV